MHWRGLVDSLVLALVIYLVLRWGREARAFRVSLAIVGLRVGAVVARQLGLSLTVWVLDAATLAALIVILIVFQAELRRALVRLDVMAWLLPPSASTVDRSLQAIATAAFSLPHAPRRPDRHRGRRAPGRARGRWRTARRDHLDGDPGGHFPQGVAGA
jgi:hypothetical protein